MCIHCVVLKAACLVLEPTGLSRRILQLNSWLIGSMRVKAKAHLDLLREAKFMGEIRSGASGLHPLPHHQGTPLSTSHPQGASSSSHRHLHCPRCPVQGLNRTRLRWYPQWKQRHGLLDRRRLLPPAVSPALLVPLSGKRGVDQRPESCSVNTGTLSCCTGGTPEP